MKKILLCIGFLLSVVSSVAQTANLTWVKQMSGSSNEEGRSVAIDATGNVYTVGTFSGTVDFDPGAATFNLTASANSDIYISKLDAAGNFVWAKSIGGTSPDEGRSIALDALGNVYTTGFFNGTVDFDPGAGVFNLTTATSSYDIFVSKLDAAGNFVWAKRMAGGTGALGRGYSIAVDASGNVCTTGIFRGTVDFDPGAGTFNLVSASANFDEIFISKLDATGNFVWAKRIGGTLNDVGNSICLDASGNVYTTGYFQGTVDFDPGAGTANLAPASFTVPAIFVSKLDASGNYVWAKQMSGVVLAGLVEPSGGNAIDVDASGNVYTTGYFQRLADFDPGAGTFTLSSTSSTAQDVFISKLDASGNFVWAKQLGGGANDVGTSISIDAVGDVYTAGYFQSIADFNPGAGTYTLGSAGGTDIFISKLDATGNYVWAKKLGGINNDWPYSIKVDPPGDVYTTGYFFNTVDFDPNAGVFNLTSVGNDIFVHKMSQCAADAAPSNTTPPANLILCQNQTSTLNATGTGTINWYATSTSTSVLGSGLSFTTPTLSAGSHTYFAASTNTCGAESSRTGFTITVNANPTITVNSGSICSGNSFTITPGGASTYTFEGGSAIKTPTATTSYTVVGTSTAGCVSSAFATSNVTVQTTPTITVNSGSICAGSNFTIVPSGASSYTYQGGGAVKTPTATTSYTVVGTSTAGCVSSFATSNVTVNARPIITVNSGSICSGNSFTIVPNGASTYTIQGGSAIKTPTATTSYTVIGTSTAGCVSSTFATSSVTVNTTPTITVNSGSICSGNSFTITPSGASTYTIEGGSVVKTPAANTSYTVIGTSTAGCVSSSFATSNVTVNATPTITVNSGSICSGSSFTIVPSGANTYTIQGGGAVKTPTATTSYTAIGTSTAGCVSSSFATSNVTVNTTPTISVAGGAICPGNSFTLSPTGATTYTFSSGSPIVTPTVTTTYSVSGTSSMGCVSSTLAVATISVASTLSITITGNNTLCLGQPISLTAGGATTYTWNTGATTSTIAPTPTTNTTYTVIGASGSCSNTAVKSITVNPLPTVSASSSNSLLCVGQSATLTASGASTYTWNPGGASTSISVSPTLTANYTVTGTDANGCSNSSILTQSVSACTDVKVIDSKPSISVYPNPTHSSLTIKTIETIETVLVFNSLGELVMEGNTDFLSVEELPGGIYILQVKTSGGIGNTRFIRE